MTEYVTSLYNAVMPSNRFTTAKQQAVHWLVLLSLLLGQFALGFGYGIAAENNNDEIRIPVCTSSGIEYIIWTPNGVKESAEPEANPTSGTCVLCTVSPHQLRFSLQDSFFYEPRLHRDVSPTKVARLAWPAFVLNPNAAPRAPPAI